tara:strand:+ start:92 stop:244 length:153 start_codon:yes stop_codon:yes gene_type:complete
MYSESLHRQKPIEIREKNACAMLESLQKAKKDARAEKTPKNPMCYTVISS